MDISTHLTRNPTGPGARRRALARVLCVVALAVVTCVGGVAAAASPAAAAAPVVNSFKPSSGAIGASVTIAGSGFAGATAVRFGGAAAVFRVVSGTKITATVPAAAATGPIAVTAPGGTASSTKRFTVLPSIVVSAASGPPTSSVTVSGAGFGGYEAVDVYFDTTDEALASASGKGTFSGVTIQVPAAAVPGAHYVTAVGRHSGRSAQVVFSVNTNWAQAGFSAKRQGVNPYENVLSPATVAQMDVNWTFAITGGFPVGEPAVVNGVAYVDGDANDTVYALNAATGALEWTFTTGGAVASSPAVANGVVYVGSFDHNVYALNAATGALEWTFTTGGTVASSPAVANGVVYVGSFDHNVYALNAATGALEWSFTTPGPVSGAPAVAGGVVYVSSSGRVYALNAVTGAQLWSSATAVSGASSLTVAKGLVFVVSASMGELYALEAGNGTTEWTLTVGGNGIYAAPAVAGQAVYINNSDKELYAVDEATGTPLWTFTDGATQFSPASPTVANGVVYAGSIQHLYAVNAATGAELWAFTAPVGFSDASPAVANGVVYDGGEDGNLYAFGLAGGAPSVHRPRPGQLRPDRALRPQAGHTPSHPPDR